MLHARMLKYLDVVARTGSIRRAAIELNVASSAVNRQIIGFEEELGAKIFERLPRRLLLTAAGEIIIEHVRETLKAFRQTEMRLDALKGLVRGRIIIAVTPGLAEGPMPRAVADFLSNRPGVQIALHGVPVHQIAPAVIGGEADLGVGYYLLPNAALKPLLTLETHFGAVFSPDHPLARHQRVRLSDLAVYPTVLFESGTRLREIIDLAYRRAAVSVMPAVETNSIQALKRLVADGSRVTLLNRVDVVDECEQGILAFRPLSQPVLEPQPLVIAARAHGMSNPMAALFAEELRRTLPKLMD